MSENRPARGSTRGAPDALARAFRAAPETREEPSPFLRARIHGAISRRSEAPARPRFVRMALAAMLTLAGGITLAILAMGSPSRGHAQDFAEIARAAREVSNDLRAIDDVIVRKARAVLIEPMRREAGGLDRGLRSFLESLRPSFPPGTTG